MIREIDRQKELTKKLAEAARAYYGDNAEIMSNYEYDKLYDDLVALEKSTGLVLTGSPTAKVGYELSKELPKENHERPMLSLDKTKSKEELLAWLDKNIGLLSWKLDGITLVLHYQNGKLEKAITRGNGTTGEVVTNNAKVFVNIPLEIPYKDSLSLRGEAVISYSDFKRINDNLQEDEPKYKNPRNLCSGSVRQLNNEVTARRRVHFFAFDIINISDSDMDFDNSRTKQLEWLSRQGFDVVAYRKVKRDNLLESVDFFSQQVGNHDFPTDGLVLAFDDIEYGESLGSTAKFPRDSIAFKWQDEVSETILLDIEWSPSRTGQINPIAIFEPVELEGTTVKRASVHNVSIMEELQLGIGDEIKVMKANMIIPQIAENLTRSGTARSPERCPACDEKTHIKEENKVKTLYCLNEDCPAKHVKSYTHFTSRDAMGIDGLSEATIEKFIKKGFIKEFADIFNINKHKEEILALEGFGEKSYERLWNAIEKARLTTPSRLLYSLGIPNIGLSNARAISEHFENNWDKIQDADSDQLLSIYGIGNIMAEACVSFFSQEKNKKILKDLLKFIEFEKQTSLEAAGVLSGFNFVITGSLRKYNNRKELQDHIEALGGKTGNAVNKNTSYLINNDIHSSSSKNRRAKELEIKIISEEELDAWIGGGIRP